MIDRADIVVGLAWGDEAKGKITSQLVLLPLMMMVHPFIV